MRQLLLPPGKIHKPELAPASSGPAGSGRPPSPPTGVKLSTILKIDLQSILEMVIFGLQARKSSPPPEK